MMNNKYLSRVADFCGIGSDPIESCPWLFFPFSVWALMCIKNFLWIKYPVLIKTAPKVKAQLILKSFIPFWWKQINQIFKKKKKNLIEKILHNAAGSYDWNKNIFKHPSNWIVVFMLLVETRV